MKEIFFVEINGSKTDASKRFAIDPEFYPWVKKYVNLRPEGAPSERFFVQYIDKKCTITPVGINTFYKQPKKIAEYLGLQKPDKFTGHCFRVTSASVLAEAGADMLTIKNAGGWSSDSMAQHYVNFSVNHNKKVGRMIASKILDESASKENTPPNFIGGIICKK